MKNWHWNQERRSVGEIFLDAPIEKFYPLISRLERYVEENFETYRIEETQGAKVFVKDGTIVSIQCGFEGHFIVRGIDLMGKNMEEAQEILQFEFQSLGGDEYKEYINRENALKIITDRRGHIVWVIYYSPEKW